MQQRKKRAEETVRRPRILLGCLCAAIGFESLFFWARVQNAFTVPKVVAVLLGAAALVPLLCVESMRYPVTRFSKLLIVLFTVLMAAVTVATANSISPPVSFWGGDWRRMGWITQLAMALIAVSVPFAIRSDLKNLRYLLRVVAAVGLISGAYGMLQWLGWDPLLPSFLRQQILEQFAGNYRASGTIGQPTYFANYLLYPFFSSLALLCYETSRRMRALAIANIALISVVLAIGTARGGLVGCAVGLAGFAGWLLTVQVRSSPRPARIMGWIAVLIIIAIAVTGYWSSSFAHFGTDTASVGRIILWQDVIHLIVPPRWIAGTGPGMFRVAFTRYHSNRYTAFNPDVHWETAHNVFLDRLSEQGVIGLAAFGCLIAAFGYNMIKVVRSSSDRWIAAGHVALAAGLVAGLAGSSFNGEVIPTTLYIYIWIAISFTARDCAEGQPPGGRRAKPPGRSIRITAAVAAIAAAIGFAWYAGRNWTAEASLMDVAQAVESRDESAILASAGEAERAMEHVGTYHLEVSLLITNFLRSNWNTLNGPSRTRLVQKGIDSATRAVEGTDKPMLSLMNLVILGNLSGDARTAEWLKQLQALDPYWFRTHELSARLLLLQGNLKDALREATIARQLAPFSSTTAELWKQLIAFRQQAGLEEK